MLKELQCDFQIQKILDDKIFIIDLDKGKISVTNDANNVCSYLNTKFGDKRIIYRDSMKQWGEILHENGEFLGFSPYFDNVE